MQRSWGRHKLLCSKGRKKATVVEQRGPWSYVIEDEIGKMNRANECGLEKVAGPA